MRPSDIKVAIFLAIRYIRGANIWTTLLIIFVMLLTFLNLVVIGGILEGIIVGSFVGLKNHALGDIYISAKEGEKFINRTQRIVAELESDPRVVSHSVRYGTNVSLLTEEEFFNVTNRRDRRSGITSLALGVDPIKEAEVTKLDTKIIEGDFLDPKDQNSLIIGRAIVEKYSPFGEDSIDVSPGDFVYASFGTSLELDFGGIGFSDADRYRKYKIAGIFRTKAGELDIAVFSNADIVRFSEKNPGGNASHIAVRLRDGAVDEEVRDSYLERFGDYAKVETVRDALGSFLDDIRTTFRTLGSVIGFIGLTVSSITIFIIIFVTAISRQKFIGISKGIGISSSAIRLSYVLFASFFVILGTVLGLLILTLLIIPYFSKNPLDFPFSDGILYVTFQGIAAKVTLLFIATMVAGYIPSYIIVRKPAIHAIMNR